MTNQATMTTTMKRVLVLVAVMMAALMALSTLAAPDAEAKKKKKKKPQFNTVQCPTEDDNQTCIGTKGNDHLIGTDQKDTLRGQEGTDIYQGGNGSDFSLDNSETSSDYYLFPETEFTTGDFLDFATVIDGGGDSDIVFLSSYSSQEFEPLRFKDDLFLDGPGNRAIRIVNFYDGNGFGVGKIEFFLFENDEVLTADDFKL